MAPVDAGQVPDRRRAASRRCRSATSRRASRKPTSSSSATRHQQTTSHQPLEIADGDGLLAERQAVSARLDAERGAHGRLGRGLGRHQAEELVLISEYTGGGFGSKIPGAQTMAIPALMSKKLNGRPVMMRISREEETYIGRTRPGYQGWIKMGFKKDGRVTAIDAFIVEDSGPYRRQGDHATSANIASLLYQAPNMRFRGISVATNTPPGVSQRAPGGLQARSCSSRCIDEAAQASSASIRSRSARSTRPKGRRCSASCRRTRRPGRPRNKLTSCFVKECLDKGAEMFNWEERKKQQRPAQRQQADRRGRGSGAVHRRLDRRRRPLRHQARRQALHPPGHRQPRHALGDRHRARDRRECRHAVGEVRSGLGQHRQGRAVELDPGRQPDHATRTPARTTRGHGAKRKIQELAAEDMGGSPDDYDVGDERVFRKGSPARR